jgi:hypothetical protein
VVAPHPPAAGAAGARGTAQTLVGVGD